MHTSSPLTGSTIALCGEASTTRLQERINHDVPFHAVSSLTEFRTAMHLRIKFQKESLALQN